MSLKAFAALEGLIGSVDGIVMNGEQKGFERRGRGGSGIRAPVPSKGRPRRLLNFVPVIVEKAKVWQWNSEAR